jgi:hypothetical protein
MARRITTPRSTHPHAEELDVDLTVVVVVDGWVVDVVDWCDRVVVVAGALVVVVLGGAVVVVGGAVVVVEGREEEVVVVSCAPAPTAASPSRSGIEVTRIRTTARLEGPVFMTTAYDSRPIVTGTDVRRLSAEVFSGHKGLRDYSFGLGGPKLQPCDDALKDLAVLRVPRNHLYCDVSDAGFRATPAHRGVHRPRGVD